MAGRSRSAAPSEEPDALRVWFRFIRMHRRLHAGMGRRLKAIGLSIAQFDILSTLTENEEISQQELAKRLYVTKGNISGLVDRLAEAGLLERRAMAGDRRSYALHLTDAGRRLAEQGLALQRDYVERTLGQLSTADLRELQRLLAAWRDILRHDDPFSAA